MTSEMEKIPDLIEAKLINLSLSDDRIKELAKTGFDVNNDVDEGISSDNSSPIKNEEVESSDMIQFHPAVYLQRYRAVQEVLANFLKDPNHKDSVNGCTALEIGCAEFGLHIFLKNMLDLGKIIFMDIDEKLLLDRKHNLRPLPAEFLLKTSRPKPLVVEVYAGDISKVDSRLMDETPKIWTVIAIELIEHLYPDVLRGFEISVFGVLKPAVIVITTPNADFNSVFNLPEGKFRHWDHKFEWTRLEFVQWCDKICAEFLDYRYTIKGIAEGPPETEHLGCVSQMAIFEKIERNKETEQSNPTITYPGVIQNDAYKLLDSIPYPNYIETRTIDEIILQELEYTISAYWFSKRNLEYYMEMEQTEVSYPLKDLQVMNFIPDSIRSIEYLKNLLEAANYNIRVNDKNGDYEIVIPVPVWGMESKEMSSDEEEEEDMEFDKKSTNLSIIDDDDSWE